MNKKWNMNLKLGLHITMIVLIVDTAGTVLGYISEGEGIITTSIAGTCRNHSTN